MLSSMTGYLGLAIALATGTIWFRRASAVNLPEDRTAFVVAMSSAAVLGVAALVQGAGWIGGVAAGLAIVLGSLFVLTVAVGDQKGGSGRFQIGLPIPDFTAPTDTGEPFEIASLSGNPLLLKFFRGHW